jgi:hypothetical protein
MTCESVPATGALSVILPPLLQPRETLRPGPPGRREHRLGQAFRPRLRHSPTRKIPREIPSPEWTTA